MARTGKPKNLAAALKRSPQLKVTLEPVFVASLAAQLEIGPNEWADWELRKAMLTSGSTNVHRVMTDTGPRHFYFSRQSERSAFLTFSRKQARWAIGLGLDLPWALSLVPEAQRAEARDLAHAEAKAARTWLEAERQREAEAEAAIAERKASELERTRALAS